MRGGLGTSAALDLGHLTWNHEPRAWGVTRKQSKESFAVSSRFGLRVDCSTSDRGRAVILRGYLKTESPNLRFSVDGRRMTLSPTIILAEAACGATTEHQLEIQIPTSAPPGPIGMDLGFEATLR